MTRSLLPLGLAGVLLVSACSSTQEILVVTAPAGAEVSLQRRGELAIHASVSGIGGTIAADSFEDEFISLGTSPVNYEFKRKKREVAVHGPGAGGNVTRHYIEGTIRIELPGYITVERRVRFDGDAIELNVSLAGDPETR